MTLQALEILISSLAQIEQSDLVPDDGLIETVH